MDRPTDSAATQLGLPKGAGLTPSASNNLKNVGRRFAGRGIKAPAPRPFMHSDPVHQTEEWAFLQPKNPL